MALQDGHPMRQFRFILLSATAIALAACQPQPLLPVEYSMPAPPPLQPYYGPQGPYGASTTYVRRHIVRRHYARRHHRVHCQCAPGTAPLSSAAPGSMPPVVPPATAGGAPVGSAPGAAAGR